MEFLLWGSLAVLSLLVGVAVFVKRSMNKRVRSLEEEIAALEEEKRNTHSFASVKVIDPEKRDERFGN